MVFPVLWIDTFEVIKKEIHVLTYPLTILLVGTRTATHIELVRLEDIAIL